MDMKCIVFLFEHLHFNKMKFFYFIYDLRNMQRDNFFYPSLIDYIACDANSKFFKTKLSVKICTVLMLFNIYKFYL